MDLSIIITAHNEGIIAHKTMLSVFEAIKNIEKKYSYEIIIHIDRGDKDTIKYFQRYEKQKRIKIFTNNFGDLGDSRNYAAQHANGKYLAFLDGDDLISDNWFLNGLDCLTTSSCKIMVHPHAVLNFGFEQRNVLHIQKDFNRNSLESTLTLIGENCWCSTIMGEKEDFLKFKYRHMGNGYGYEDYALNVETTHNGINHIVAPNTVLFYRRSSGSMLSSYNSDMRVLPYTELFDFKNFQSSDFDQIKVSNMEKIKTSGYKLYKKIRSNNTINYFITPIAKIAVKQLDKRRNKNKTIPQFVIEAWRKINTIETQLYPRKHNIRKTIFYSPEIKLNVGHAYLKLAKNISKTPDYVFIIPWLVCGGAEKVILNYIAALKHNSPEVNIAVIATLPVKHIWKNKLPDNVDFIDFGNIASGLPPSERDTLFSRLIVQLQCKRLHIVNSEYGYQWAMSHKTLLKSEYKLSTSLFAGEYIPNTAMQGIFSYDDPYMVDIYPVIDKIFTDNKTIIEKSTNKNGFDPSKFVVHYQPVHFDIKSYNKPSNNDGKIHILWASRITNTKLPSIVASIGKQLDPKKYVIDMYGTFDADIKRDIFQDNPVISLKGAYDGFCSIDASQYNLFLYTSMNDGIPNVILEVAAAGLPIIASDDGGVSEFIKNDKTGILVYDFLNPQAYVKAIKTAAKMPNEQLQQYVENSQKLLKKQHSLRTFTELVKRDF